VSDGGKGFSPEKLSRKDLHEIQNLQNDGVLSWSSDGEDCDHDEQLSNIREYTKLAKQQETTSNMNTFIKNMHEFMSGPSKFRNKLDQENYNRQKSEFERGEET
jgi:hypothetical protein